MPDKAGYIFTYADTEAPYRIVILLRKTWRHATGCMEFLEKGICKAHEKHVLRFQEDGVRWMVTNPKNILHADEMGLGKTVQACLYINCAYPRYILIVCAKNAKLVWKHHLEELMVKPYEVEMVST